MARVACYVTLVSLRHGQYAMSGNSIFFHQDLDHVIQTLPRADNNIVTYGKLRVDGRVSYLRVRRGKVTKCLHYLRAHSPAYSDIQIDQAALSQLPEDGFVRPGFHVEAADQQGPDFDSAVPQAPTYDAQQELVDQLHHRGFFPFPTHSDHPVSEFGTPWLLSKSFPALFPDGKAEYFIGANRPLKKLSFAEYVGFLMSHKDNRFRGHLVFKFFAINFLRRLRIMETSRLAIEKRFITNVSVEDFSNPGFLQKIGMITSSVVGEFHAYFKFFTPHFTTFIRHICILGGPAK